MKRIVIWTLLALMLAACGSRQETPEAPSPLEQEMTALYGENAIIDGDYPDSLAIEASNGIFVGVSDDGLLAFKGIPYAVQPTGDLRWRVAKPEPDSRLVREAKYFGHSAIQWRSKSNAASLYKQGEDCLTLNVWTAAEGMRNARRPVIVWIHGGSYVSDGSVNPRNWGNEFVKAHPGVVFVSLNYRMGLLGYLDLSSQRHPGPDGSGRSLEVGKTQYQVVWRRSRQCDDCRALGGSGQRLVAGEHRRGPRSVPPRHHAERQPCPHQQP